jgi:hypothetical protein
VIYHLTQNGQQKFTNSNGIFSEVPEGMYIVQAAGPRCNTWDTITINPKPEWPAKPVFALRDPNCDVATGRIVVSNYKANATYKLVQGLSLMYSSTDSVFVAVATGAYSLVVTIGECQNNEGVVVSAQPFVPALPTSTVLPPTCTNDKGQVTITNKQSNVLYTLTKGEAVSYSPNGDGVFSSVGAGTYTLLAQSTISVCKRSSTAVVNDQPPTPQAPVLIQQAPDFCSDKGSVTISAPLGENLLFSKDGGTSWQSSRTFEGLAAGRGADWSFKVKNVYGCISTAGVVCTPKTVALGGEINTSSNGFPSSHVAGESTSSNSQGSEQARDDRFSKYLGSGELTDPTVTLKAVPNPFGAQVRFLINNPVAGKGVLEIFDTKGQLVKRVYEGYIFEGPSFFDLKLPVNNRTEFIYVLRIGDKRISGKLLHIGSNRY